MTGSHRKPGLSVRVYRRLMRTDELWFEILVWVFGFLFGIGGHRLFWS